MSESWLPVVGYEGLYEVSDLGRVRSLERVVPHGPRSRRIPERMRKVQLLPSGYLQVGLARNGQGIKSYRVHILVAAAFLGPRPTGLEIRHLDGDKLNNAPENLAYGTHSENMLDVVRHGSHLQANRTHCPQGHVYDEANTILRRAGWRTCRACMKARAVSEERRVSRRRPSVKRTHCKRGHPFDDEFVRRGHGRLCRTCKRARDSVAREAKRYTDRGTVVGNSGADVGCLT